MGPWAGVIIEFTVPCCIAFFSIFSKEFNKDIFETQISTRANFYQGKFSRGALTPGKYHSLRYFFTNTAGWFRLWSKCWLVIKLQLLLLVILHSITIVSTTHYGTVISGSEVGSCYAWITSVWCNIRALQGIHDRLLILEAVTMLSKIVSNPCTYMIRDRHPLLHHKQEQNLNLTKQELKLLYTVNKVCKF